MNVATRAAAANPRGCKTGMLLTAEILIFDLATRNQREREREREETRGTLVSREAANVKKMENRGMAFGIARLGSLKYSFARGCLKTASQ
jgi:hypothetical protein